MNTTITPPPSESSNINYDNTTSGLTATDIHGAIDELNTIKVDESLSFNEASTRTNINSGESFSTILGKIKKFFSDLKTVAFSGSYNDLDNKPTIPTVNNATLTINQNGTSKGTFTANASSNVTVDLTDNNTTYSANNGVGLSGTTFYNSGVRSIATGSTNGTISVNTNGTAANVAVKGLSNCAYISTGSDTTKYLRNDGSWVKPPNDNTTYSANNGVGLSGTTFYNSGVRDISINGNYLRKNVNGTNTDLTIPYATNAGTATNSTKVGNIGIGDILAYKGYARDTLGYTDANSIVTTGVYYIGGTTISNLPSSISTYCTLIVITAPVVTQILINSGGGNLQIRTKSGSPATWSSWTAHN